MAENSPHVQVKFVTTQKKYAVPESPFVVSVDSGITELNDLINTLLQGEDEQGKNVEFDFLISGEFLRKNLHEYLLEKELTWESVISIEYIERSSVPKPAFSLIHDDWVSCVKASEHHILSGSYDKTVHLWSNEGASLMTVPAHTAPVKAVSWIHVDDNSTKHFITASHDQTLNIWCWNRHKNEVDCMCCCKGHAGSVDCVSVNPSKQQFCSGSWDTMVKVWTAAVSDLEEEENIESQPIKKLKTTGRRIPTRVPLLTLAGHSEGVSSVHWLENNEICTSSWDHTIKLWDVESAREKSTIQGNKVFLDIDYSLQNHSIIAASADRHIRLYDPRSSDGAKVKNTFTSHTGWISSVAWAPGKEFNFISGSYDMLVKVWDIRSCQAPLYSISGHTDKVFVVDWSDENLLLSGGADNHLKIFNYEESKNVS